MEQSRDLTNRNWIRGESGRTSERRIAKSTSIKGPGCRFSKCATKAVELTSGGLRRVPRSGTEGVVRLSDHGAEVSRGHSRCGNEPSVSTTRMVSPTEGPNGLEWQVGR